MLTNEQKKYRDHANRARRELFKEKEKFGAISDGSGKRYRVCVYFVLSGAPEKAADFIVSNFRLITEINIPEAKQPTGHSRLALARLFEGLPIVHHHRSPNKVMSFAPPAPDVSFGVVGYERR